MHVSSSISVLCKFVCSFIALFAASVLFYVLAQGVQPVEKDEKPGDHDHNDYDYDPSYAYVLFKNR